MNWRIKKDEKVDNVEKVGIDKDKNKDKGKDKVEVMVSQKEGIRDEEKEVSEQERS